MFATRVDIIAGYEPSLSFTITEKAPRRAFFFLKVPTSASKFETQSKDTMLNRLGIVKLQTSRRFVSISSRYCGEPGCSDC